MSKILRRLATILVTCAFVAIGYYVINGANADTDERTLIDAEQGIVAGDYRQGTVFTRGFRVNLHYEFTNDTRSDHTLAHVIVELGHKSSETTPVNGANGINATCNDSFVTCTVADPALYDDLAANSRGIFGSQEYVRDFALCIDFKKPFTLSNYPTQSAPVFTANYKMVKTGNYTLAMAQQWVSGTCASPSTSQHGAIGVIASGYCELSSGACNGSGDGGGDGTGTGSGSGGNGSGGSGTGTNGQGSGGGGGGTSSASRQSDLPNQVPKTSPQGSANNTTQLTPSPFYDGKEYLLGSEADHNKGIVSGVIHKTTQNWPYITLTIMLLGCGFYVGWRYYGSTLRRLLPAKLQRRVK